MTVATLEETVLLPRWVGLGDTYGALARFGGAPSDVAALAEESDSAYLQASFEGVSGPAGKYTKRFWRFPVPSLPDGSTIVTLRAEWRASRTGGLAWSHVQIGIPEAGELIHLDSPVDGAVRDFATREQALRLPIEDAPHYFTLTTVACAMSSSTSLGNARLYRVRLVAGFVLPEPTCG